MEQFQEVFSQKVAAKKSASPADGSGEQSSGGKASPKTKAAPTFSALDGKRAQGVGILMGSTKMDAWKMSRAVYEMDPSVCSLEKMKAIYEQRYTPEELSMATAHLEAQVALPAEKRSRLAPGDQFLYGLSQISFFEARVDCMLFTSRFAENIFDVKDRIGVLGDACDALRDADALPEVLGIVLACGNYMNGGSRRGQADGFNIDILPKLRDVSPSPAGPAPRHIRRRACCSPTAHALSGKVEGQHHNLAPLRRIHVLRSGNSKGGAASASAAAFRRRRSRDCAESANKGQDGY